MIIKLIDYMDKKYLYDANCNRIVEITEELYTELKKSAGLSENSRVKEEIENLINKGYLKNCFPEKIEHSYTPFVSTTLNNLKKVTLQVTQACNFKCRYCGYAGDNYLNRKHNGLSMSWETAKRAIDFYIQHSKSSPIAYFGFYGGEPLLEIDLIKECIEYIEDILKGREITYFITTNGTLINDKVVELLNKYAVILAISLDGPEKLHNKNRRYAINGKETYADVIKGIDYLRKNVSDFNNKVKINSVIDQQENYLSYVHFFDKNEDVSDIEHEESTIDDSRLSKNIVPSKEYFKTYNRAVINTYINLILERETNSAMTKAILNDIYTLAMAFKVSDNFGHRFHHGGPCVPGYNRLFVTVNGELFPCEKCSENSKVLRIGTIFDGYDYKTIERILNIGQLTEERCKKCVVARHCSICAQKIDDIDKLSVARKLTLCQMQEKELEHKIKKYIFYSKVGLIEEEL